MVKLGIVIILFPFFLFSGEFTASLSQNPVYVGESFTLSLTLKDVSARATPPLEPIRKLFQIHSQQQSSHTTIVNGKVSSGTTWKLILIAAKEGEITIPPLQMDTSEGVLTTEPIQVHVMRSTREACDSNGLFISAEASQLKPYKNEQVLYTVTLYTKLDLVDVNMQKMQIEDVILTPHGEPKVYEKIVDGIRMGVIEFKYSIIPLKTGVIKIPPPVIHGGIADRKKPGSAFDTDLDLFSMIHGMDRVAPFTMTAEEILLDVQLPVVGVNPWLPARSLQIEEHWNPSQTLQVGEPFTRSFTITAEGCLSSQLPSLEQKQLQDPTCKLYSDTPECNEQATQDKMLSIRKETYTFIPHKDGSLILPEISVKWWDVVKNEERISRIPERMLHILPASESVSSQSIEEEPASVSVAEQPPVMRTSPTVYLVFGFLLIFLLVAIGWGILLQRKLRRFSSPSGEMKKPKTKMKLRLPRFKKKSKPRDKKEKLPDLNPT